MPQYPPPGPLPSPVVLCILDGVGWGAHDDGDAVFLARTPTLDRLTSGAEPDSSWGLLAAHGKAVGLPSDDDMGNSEVGHNAMGAGRVFDQGAKLVDQAIADGSIWASPTWAWLLETVAGPAAGTLHLLGLVSDGNVHSHIDHLLALVSRAQAEGVQRLRVHVLTDGRDVGERTALTWVTPLEESLARLRADGLDYAVGSGGGRMRITMDRYEADWPMVARGWRCHVHGEGERFPSATEAIETLYARDPDTDDQWLSPFLVGDYAGMDDGDAVVFFNFRGDRAIEITRAFEQDDLTTFDRGRRPAVRYAGMMEYDGDLKLPTHFLVSPPAIDQTVGETLSAAGARTFAISETQKFGHVTYFFNGNNSARLPGETWKEIPSPPGDFDEHPEMSAREVTASACEAIRSGLYDHVRLNLANGDMVGHTGDLPATILAMEVVDSCVADLVAATRAAGGVIMVTADHGNADDMWMRDKKSGAVQREPDGRPRPRTSHSLNPVPFIVVDPSGSWEVAADAPGQPLGGLARIGASVLTLCGVRPPAVYLPAVVRRRARAEQG